MMKNSILILKFFFATLSLSAAYNIKQQSLSNIGRRGVFNQFVSVGAVAAFVSISPANAALEVCPKGSKNCIRTKWSPPAGTEANAAASTLKKIIENYPSNGQNKIDLGGWMVVGDSSFSPGKVVSIEYKSGIGNFAKFLNGGKAFVDDLKLEIGSDGVVDVRSSSRIGESDLGVNQKRLSFIVASLKEEGWDCTDPAY
mmetsp:Transcript_39432/g.39869  ORF Transcript_39432/g.39869 Transcript_39432/m.39869 type:complete len:199 (+) Transcript_39432:63-659(+)